MMVTRFRASGWPHAERQDRSRPGAEQQACWRDLEPRLRRRLPADRSRRNVDHDLLGTIVPHRDPSRGGRGECEPRRRDREGDARPVGARPLRVRGGRQHKRGEDRECEGESHRATAVNVTVAV